MNEWQCRLDERRSWCYFHPSQLLIGICPLCLNERLLVLASKKAHLHLTHKFFTAKPKSLTKIFALLNRLDITKQQKPDDHDQYHSHITSSTTPEDSFISIKFEENGVASWDKGKISKMPHDRQSEVSSLNKGKKIKTVVEHGKPRGTMRWRRPIGQLLQLIRWKRSSKANMCHVGTKLEGGSGVKYGLVKTLTKRRAKE
ncbi:UNVERIFIED_CONTAM: hypothetical protein Scaly_1144500 [Sesamum calycinum]|uniref:Uncharacterized protein n=1 Tax=Sesamum calycinum TaxID=2727403 RepID=A0AAW2QND1_9LAMI